MFFILSALIFCPLLSGYAQDGYFSSEKPGVEINYQVVLSTPMEEALRKNNPDFKILGRENFKEQIVAIYQYESYQSPSAVFGDFNGDNLIDVVLMGYVLREYGEQGEINAILSKSETGEYEFVGIGLINSWHFKNRRPVDVDLILLAHRQGEIIDTKRPQECGVKGVITLKTDAFGIKNFDSKNKETLFPCGDMPMVVSCLIDN